MACGLQGMEYLHSKRIVHFDLKSANLLLGYKDRRAICKVADFGLSKQKRDTYVSNVSSQRGTLPWIAPEIIKTPHAVTEKVYTCMPETHHVTIACWLVSLPACYACVVCCACTVCYNITGFACSFTLTGQDVFDIWSCLCCSHLHVMATHYLPVSTAHEMLSDTPSVLQHSGPCLSVCWILVRWTCTPLVWCCGSCGQAGSHMTA